jgi:hypothetical protein
MMDMVVQTLLHTLQALEQVWLMQAMSGKRDTISGHVTASTWQSTPRSKSAVLESRARHLALELVVLVRPTTTTCDTGSKQGGIVGFEWRIPNPLHAAWVVNVAKYSAPRTSLKCLSS